MLSRRENRVKQQEQLLAKYHCPVLSFCMNIPGPVKTNAQIRYAFDLGKKAILKQIHEHSWNILVRTEISASTGDELLLAVDAPAADLKEMATHIEESLPLGRLYDIDILDVSGQKLSRPVYRKCLLCDRQAKKCARSRTHSVEQLQEAVERLLNFPFSIPV